MEFKDKSISVVIPKKESRFEKALDYSSLFALLVLLNPNAWMHNFVVLLFIYMTLFYHLIKTNFKDKVTVTYNLLCEK